MFDFSQMTPPLTGDNNRLHEVQIKILAFN